MRAGAAILGLAAALACGTALAAGGHDSDHANGGKDAGSQAGKPGDPTKVKRTIEVVMSDNMRFTPARITAKRGETVKFVVKNTGQLKHEMVLGTTKELKAHAELMRKMPGMQHAEPNQVTLEPGQSGELVWQFTRAGAFTFACLIPGHFEAGMVGRAIVSSK